MTEPGGTGPGGDDLAALVDRVPPGWTAVRYGGRRWGLSRTDRAAGGTVAIAAQELGGTGWVSTNVLRLRSGDVLRPCEMPAADVLEFLRGWTEPAALEAVSTAAEGNGQSPPARRARRRRSRSRPPGPDRRRW